jgi:hypothetical protein
MSDVFRGAGCYPAKSGGCGMPSRATALTCMSLPEFLIRNSASSKEEALFFLKLKSGLICAITDSPNGGFLKTGAFTHNFFEPTTT